MAHARIDRRTGAPRTGPLEYQDLPGGGPKGEAAIAQVQPTEPIPADAAVKSVTQEITTLEPAKAYRVRLVAKPHTGDAVQSNWMTLEKFGATSEQDDAVDDPKTG